jgi:hypothetical protein
MKHKITIFTVLVGITLWTTGTHADGMGLFAAYLDPSDGREVAGIGIRGRGGIELLYFEIRGTYFESIPEVGFDLDQELSVLPVDVGFGWQTDWEAKLQLYGGGGVSYYFLDVDNGSVDNAVGYYLEVGGELEIIEGFGVFIEAIWRTVDTERDEGGSLSQSDLSIEGKAIHLGVMLRR